MSRISPAPRSHALARPRDARRGPSPSGRRRRTPPSRRRAPLGVDGEHDALRAEHAGELPDQLRPRDRRRVDRDLVGARVEHGLGVGQLAHAAADRERHEDLVGRAAGELDDRGALVRRRGDVEEDELVGALAVVERGQLDRIAGVADVEEPGALDDAPGVDVHARDDALVVHRTT